MSDEAKQLGKKAIPWTVAATAVVAALWQAFREDTGHFRLQQAEMRSEVLGRLDSITAKIAATEISLVSIHAQLEALRTVDRGRKEAMQKMAADIEANEDRIASMSTNRFTDEDGRQLRDDMQNLREAVAEVQASVDRNEDSIHKLIQSQKP